MVFDNPKNYNEVFVNFGEICEMYFIVLCLNNDFKLMLVYNLFKLI